MPLKHSFVFWFVGVIGIYTSTVRCQTPANRLPADLFNKESKIQEIHLFQKNYDKPLFRYKEVPQGTGNNGTLIKASNELVYIPSGTGQVLAVKRNSRDLSLERLDSTILQGYNNDAFNFIFRDTIYSFGGYGFWKFNGQLRFYISSMHEWEILPLTQEQIFAKSRSNPWLDPENGTLIYASPTPAPYLANALRPTAPYYDTSSVWKVHIPTQQVSHLGKITRKTVEILNNDQSIVGTQLGLLFYSTGTKHKQLNILDYENNSVNLLSREKSDLILRFFDRFWASNDIGNVLTAFRMYDSVGFYFPPDNRLVIGLSERDITATGDKIYLSDVASKKDPDDSLTLTIALALISVFSLLINLRFYRQARNGAQRESFEHSESALIIHILNAPEVMVSIESINEFLGISDRSVDTQKKYRSEMVRNINRKFKSYTGKSDNLIIQLKSSYDKRLLNYSILPENHPIVKKMLPDTGDH